MILARIFTLGLGCLAILWAVLVFPSFWRHSPIERTAVKIIDGHPFTSGVLRAQVPDLLAVEQETICRPSALRSSAIIRLRIAEDSISAGTRDSIDDDMQALRNTIRLSLACSPADPFLWLILFWTENTTNGFSLDNLKYLHMSYQLGPNEGWIGLKRNHAAFAIFEQLPPDLADTVIREFVKLLKSGLHRQAADIFAGPAWRLRDQLVPRLKDIDPYDLRIFAKALYDKGLDVVIPGVKPIDGPR